MNPDLSTARKVADLQVPLEDMGAIVGQIIDKEEQQGLPHAAVFVSPIRSNKYEAGADAEENGYFYIELTPGSYELTSRYIGFDDVRLDSIEIQANTMSIVEIELGVCTLRLVEPDGE